MTGIVRAVFHSEGLNKWRPVRIIIIPVDGYEDIDIYFNSGGGDVFAGLAIYNQLKRYDGHKVGYVDGMAASIASVIMFACDELHFATGAQAMIHKPLCMAYGNADDFKAVIKQLNLCEDSILDVYMEHVQEGVTRDKIQSLMSNETYINKWIAKKTKATRNAMILKVLNEMTKGKEVTVENLDSLKDIFNEQLDPAIADNAVVITNQSGFNYLDKLKDKDGNYILQKDPTQQTKGKMLFGEYPIIKLSKKTLASEKIMNTDGHTIDGYKHPIFCGDLKEAVTLFDRNVLTIDLNDKGAGLWDKDMTGIKVRDRFDVQPVDKGAVIKGQITEVING